jgi:hypothetical protein
MLSDLIPVCFSKSYFEMIEHMVLYKATIEQVLLALLRKALYPKHSHFPKIMVWLGIYAVTLP